MRRHVLTLGTFGVLIGLFAFAANDGKPPWAAKAVHGADWCKAHDVPLSTCEKCKPELSRGGTYSLSEREPMEGECPNTVVRVHLAPGLAEKLGLDFHTVEARQVSETVRANAEAIYPPSRYARIAPRLPGVVKDVKVSLGQEVEPGTVLATVESVELGQAKSDYLQALSLLHLRRKTMEREKALFDQKITTGREMLEAETQFEEANLGSERASQRLSTLGMTSEAVQAVRDKRDTSVVLDVVAPFSGTVVEASAVTGENAGPEKPIFAVASLERLWLSVDVLEPDSPKLAKDQRVIFTVDSLPGRRFPGKLVAVGSEVDDRSRTVRAFAEVKNVDGLLRARMFGRAELTVKPAEPRIILPKQAVQHDGDCYLVFVSPSANAFKARKIEVGHVTERGYEVTGGLASGEKVVVRGSFLLKSEVMRGQMGAG